jgi:L-arabinose isomerase
MARELRVGLFGIGLDIYWEQFEGMRERLEDYVTRVAQRLQLPGVSVVNLGLVDSAEKGFAAGHRFCPQFAALGFL